MATAAAPERKASSTRLRLGMQAVKMEVPSMICDQMVGMTACQVGSNGVEERKGFKSTRARIAKMGTLFPFEWLISSDELD